MEGETRVEGEGDDVTLFVSGGLGLGSADQFVGAAIAAVGDRDGVVTVDLAEVTAIDSLGMRALLRVLAHVNDTEE